MFEADVRCSREFKIVVDVDGGRILRTDSACALGKRVNS